MNKEPIGLYIFRFVLGLALFAFMGMLYWSSVLVEDNLRHLRSEISSLKNDMFSIRAKTDKMCDKMVSKILQNQENWQKVIQKIGVEPKEGAIEQEEAKGASKLERRHRPHIDPMLPNLLSEDLFYAETLPRLLGPNFEAHGTFQGAAVGKPNDLHPFSNWSHILAWTAMCRVSAARMETGKYETFAPNMAIKIESRSRKDSTASEFWIHLRDAVYWQPLSEKMFADKVELAPKFLRKHQVTAHDFKFFFDAVMNPHVQKPGAVALRNYIGDIEEIEVVDDLTFVVRWRTHEVVKEGGESISKIKYIGRMWTGALTPLPRFVYQYFADGTKIVDDDGDPETYRKNSVWAQNFSEHWAKNIIVSCGPWIFKEMTDRQIKFRRNPDHFFPYDNLAKKSVFVFKNSPDNVWQEFKTKAIDTHVLRPDQLVELDDFLASDLYKQQEKEGAAVKRIDYNGRTYAYIGWNMNKAFFKSQKVRQALTQAIDRKRIIDQYLNGMGMQVTGPFSPFSSAYDKTIPPWPFDPDRSREILEGEGWYDSDGDGIIDKVVDGKATPFDFSLTYYVKNPTSKAICEYVSTALKEIGIRCRLNGVDLGDLSAEMDDKEFDAVLMGWAGGTPPEDPRQLWHSEGAKEPGSSNIVGFANGEADLLIEKLAFEDNKEARGKLYHRFHRIINEEQPYTFLYAPKTVMLYREYIKNVFIPAERQDLIPGADVAEPLSSIFWIKKRKG